MASNPHTWLIELCCCDIPPPIGDWLTGNQTALIFHSIPASTASCTGFTRNKPEGMHVRFSTDTASHWVGQPACPNLFSPVLAWPGSSCRTPEDDSLKLFKPTMRKAELMLTALVTPVLSLTFLQGFLGCVYKHSVNSELYSVETYIFKRVTGLNNEMPNWFCFMLSPCLYGMSNIFMLYDSLQLS